MASPFAATTPSALSDSVSDITLFIEMPADSRARLDSYRPRVSNDDTADLLRQTFKYLPPDGRANLVEDILQCTLDSQLHQLGQNIVTGLLNPLKVAGGKTATITPSPRLGVEDSIENLEAMIDDPMKRAQKELRKKCLRRDGQMCVVSSLYNTEEEEMAPAGKMAADLEAAHVIPFDLANFKDDAERHFIASVWTTMYRYFPSVRSRLNFHYEDINNTANVMMLERGIHHNFGKFRLALEPTGHPNQYKILTFPHLAYPARMLLPPSGLVTLVAHDGRDELPSPILLGLHAAIAKILHATGRGETIERLLQDYDDIAVLARNGSTNLNDLLSVSKLPAIVQRPFNVPQPGTLSKTDEGQKVRQQSPAQVEWQKRNRLAGKEN
ncbi:hypothetical protein ASPZODRAFT_133580 [Penicilliopsis zonata CBS 506.65]|uniref:HNH nuclease domain-containing protein n=1 Tax=Penicilliopsis zonata CBS 506.65 TaxID=1073090 RepID=A0A1L9SET4_9EURO|nr:hypothetical protein ASPZODRAFT_133580 [Penicilliopsis zonata CBS 506.65]OJJ45716.1 hypothetical protein ASPZODRAFT_133580 [Penicilliopsis zonata CBS 506.65]